MMGEKQCRDSVACAIDRDRKLRRAQAIPAAIVAGDKVDRVRRRFVGDERGHQHRARPKRAQRVNCSNHVGQIACGAAGEMVKLEVVGRNHIGGRNGVQAHELRYAGLHEYAASNDADHWIAHYHLGSVHLKQQQIGAAIRHFSLSLGINPEFEPARQALDAAIALNGVVSESKPQAIAAPPSDPTVAEPVAPGELSNSSTATPGLNTGQDP